ncbi:cytochrome P450 6a2-like [Euwallacea fornicatus]|uniref:cytochrome P450 6a2-like n=1 Tax=Euwallacea fornicatus TaxID=995702 RepID=UPI00338E1537
MILVYVVVALVGFFVHMKWRQTYWQRKGVINLRPPSSAFTQPLSLPVDSNLIKQILTKGFHYLMGRESCHHRRDVLTMDLFNLEEEQRKYLRSKLTPTFTSRKIKVMFETLLKKTEGLETLVDKTADLKKIVSEYAESGETFAIKEIVAKFTTEIIGSCAFGTEYNYMEDPKSQDLLPNLGYKVTGSDVTPSVTLSNRQNKEKKIFCKDFISWLLLLENQGGRTTSLQLKEIPGTKQSRNDVVYRDCRMIQFKLGLVSLINNFMFSLNEKTFLSIQIVL